MKNILLTLASTLLACAAANAEESTTERAKEKAAQAWDVTKDAARAATQVVVEESREAWSKTKAYLSNDPVAYRAGVKERVKRLDDEITRLEKESTSAMFEGRDYFRTRVKALREHLAYVKTHAEKLPEGEDDLKAARKEFDHALNHLDKATDQATAEARGGT